METRIEPVQGEVFRFLVASESRSDLSFLVDLQANGLRGFCACEDFEARCGVNRTKERCKHITAAREWLLDQVLTRLAAQTGQVEEAIS